ncbi:cytochrome P450 [Kribbella catacumbae]|uniref:cytochrome P450 n=1 Tax=Kribbella catacumbae TaxID=460086 RepID=UPI00036286D0|nr:cytochrome P450 [Kribbella catacumbae]
MKFPMARTCPYQPPPEYAVLREAGPITKAQLFDGRMVWVVTGHAEARQLFSDARLSVDRSNPDYPRLAHSPVDPAAMKAVQTFVDMDEPEHATHRRMVVGSFTVRRTRALRPAIDADVEKLVTRLLVLGPPVDLFAELAVPLSAKVFARLFGVPAREAGRFHDLMRLAAERMTSGKALYQIQESFDRRITELAEGRAELADDLLSTLVAGPLKDGELTQKQLLNMCMTLLVSGHENTFNLIGLSTLTLLEHSEHRLVLRKDPTAAVEELLRYLSIADTVPRLAIAEIEIAGERIQPGDGVILPVAAANRDAGAFPDPDRLDLGRPARHHLAFGHGVHQCLGQHLVREVLEATVIGLFGRLPRLRLAVPMTEIPVRGAIGVQGISALPVSW